ncbi:nucleotidyltransferase family protein [Cellulophaga lytica]|nr:nucleotidyltransferase family protein [Cellulophaga lytica]
MKIANLILAAGSSTRMQQTKQVLPYKDTTLLGNAVQQAESTALLDVYVVLGANAAEIKKEINVKEKQVFNNLNWKKGLGSSIAHGIVELQKLNEEYNAVLISLADQPLIDSAYLTKMVSLFSTSVSTIVATNYGDRVGVPAIFDSEYFAELRQLNEDFGAKEILIKHASEIVMVEPNGKEIDVDTQQDYNSIAH